MLKSQTASCDDRMGAPGLLVLSRSCFSLFPSLGPPTLQTPDLSPRPCSFPAPPWPCFSSPEESATFPPGFQLLLACSFADSHSCSTHSWLPTLQRSIWPRPVLCFALTFLVSVLQLRTGLFLPGQDFSLCVP